MDIILIKIKYRNSWVNASDEQVLLFQEYRQQNRYREIPLHKNNMTIFRENNNPHTGIYIQINNSKYPICDWNDVKLFLTNQEPVDWYRARDYQTWAFFDYIYDDKPVKTYASCGSQIADATVIDVNNLSAGIIFKLGRNDNDSIYLERNDINQSQSRISDNEWSRLGYRGFYTRITMDPGMIVIPPSGHNHNHTNKIALPANLQIEETDDENLQCLLCACNKINIKFMPCAHSVECSLCYTKMEKNVCPVCKTEITAIVKV
jgi:hypothetical protein